MNEDTAGYIVTFTFLLLFFGVPIFIARRLYLKRLAAKEKLQPENQPERIEEDKPASAGSGTFSLATAAAVVVFSGWAYGMVFAAVSMLFYILFVFPLLMGAAGGKLVADTVRKFKIRGRWQVIVLSVLAAVSIYGTFHYGRYLGLQVQMFIAISPELPESSEGERLAAAKVIVDYGMEQETGHSGFPGYMLYRAREGTSIGRFYSSSRLHLGPLLTVLYWLAELGIILGIMVLMGRKKKVKGSFYEVCEVCGSRLGSEKHLGGTAWANESLVLELIGQKDFTGLGKLIEPDAEVPSLELYVQGCKACQQSQSRLVVRRAFQGPRGGLQIKDAAQALLQPVERSRLLSQLSLSGD